MENQTEIDNIEQWNTAEIRKKLKFINRLGDKELITANKMIMDYASNYSEREDAAEGELEAINPVRLHKR